VGPPGPDPPLLAADTSPAGGPNERGWVVKARLHGEIFAVAIELIKVHRDTTADI
jgi:hypothetical protein